MVVRKYAEKDILKIVEIWNHVVEEGIAFPQEDLLTNLTGKDFFESQTFCGVAEDEESGDIVGLYILLPNSIDRCSHISNASYAVNPKVRGKHIGERLVMHCIHQAYKEGFRIL